MLGADDVPEMLDLTGTMRRSDEMPGARHWPGDVHGDRVSLTRGDLAEPVRVGPGVPWYPSRWRASQPTSSPSRLRHRSRTLQPGHGRRALTGKQLRRVLHGAAGGHHQPIVRPPAIPRQPYLPPQRSKDGADPGPEAGGELGVGVSAARVYQHEQGLAVHGQAPPAGAAFAAAGVQQVGEEAQGAGGQGGLGRQPVYQELHLFPDPASTPALPRSARSTKVHGVSRRFTAARFRRSSAFLWFDV